MNHEGHTCNAVIEMQCFDALQVVVIKFEGCENLQELCFVKLLWTGDSNVPLSNALILKARTIKGSIFH